MSRCAMSTQVSRNSGGSPSGSGLGNSDDSRLLGCPKRIGNARPSFLADPCLAGADPISDISGESAEAPMCSPTPGNPTCEGSTPDTLRTSGNKYRLPRRINKKIRTFRGPFLPPTHKQYNSHLRASGAQPPAEFLATLFGKLGARPNDITHSPEGFFIGAFTAKEKRYICANPPDFGLYFE